MDQVNWVKILSAITLIFLLFLANSIATADMSIVKIATGELSGYYYPAGGAIAEIVNKKAVKNGFRCVVEIGKDSVSNVDAITSGDVDLAIVQSDVLYNAFMGLGAWKEQGPQSGVRAVFGLFVESVTVVASGDLGIDNIKGLKNKLVYLGGPDSDTRAIAYKALSASGIDCKKEILEFDKVPNVTTFYSKRKIRAFFKTTSHPDYDISYAISSVPGTRFISIGHLESILKDRPYYTKTFIPISAYPGVANQKDVETFGTRAILIASSNVPSPVIYTITKEVFENIEAFKDLYSRLEFLTKENMLECITAKMHFGAMKYYEETKTPLPEYCVGLAR